MDRDSYQVDKFIIPKRENTMDDRKFLEQLLRSKKMELGEIANQKRVSMESYDTRIACTRELIDYIERHLNDDKVNA
jgi:hypothetical protein